MRTQTASLRIELSRVTVSEDRKPCQRVTLTMAETGPQHLAAIGVRQLSPSVPPPLDIWRCGWSRLEARTCGVLQFDQFGTENVWHTPRHSLARRLPQAPDRSPCGVRSSAGTCTKRGAAGVKRNPGITRSLGHRGARSAAGAAD